MIISKISQPKMLSLAIVINAVTSECVRNNNY